MNAAKWALMEKIESSWESRDFTSFEVALSAFPLTDVSDFRFHSHWSAKKDLIQGQLEMSLQKLNEALVNYGPHVGLLSDIVSVHYLMKNSAQFKAGIARVVSEYEFCKNQLSPKSKIKTLLFLGKLMEFEGELHKSYRFYQETLHLAEGHDEIKNKILAQILRLDSFCSPVKTCALHYNMLIGYRGQGRDLDIEVLHALLLAECRLFGAEIAENRLKRIYQKGLSTADFKQLACHFLEEAVHQNHQPNQEWLQTLRSIEPLDFDSYESTVLGQFGIEVSTNDDNAVSLFDDLRRLALCYTRATSPDLRRALKSQILFMLRPLSLESQKIYLKKWDFLRISDEPTNLLVDFKSRNISAHGKVLNLDKDLILMVLRAFSRQNEIATENLVSLVYQSSNYNESYYHRIRMLIGRFNKECQLRFGISKVISVTYENCSLVPGNALQIKLK